MSDELPQGRTLPPFPVDDYTLTHLEHALDTCISYNDAGEQITVGGEFTLPKLLEFLSGYDPERKTLIGHTSGVFGDGDIPVYQAWDAQYSEHDVMRALVARIRELEAAANAADAADGAR